MKQADEGCLYGAIKKPFVERLPLISVLFFKRVAISGTSHSGPIPGIYLCLNSAVRFFSPLRHDPILSLQSCECCQKKKQGRTREQMFFALLIYKGEIGALLPTV
jgi:hypothetical protein